MFNVGAALRVGGLVSLGFLLSAGSSISHAQTATFVAPPRNISDITAILDQQKPDPSRAARNKAAADAEPPASGQLGQFYYRRAQARAALGRTEEAIADAQKAISLGGDFQNEVSRYMQFLAQQYRVTGNLKGSIETEQAIAKKVEEQGRGKGLLFGINLRIIVSYLTLGDLRQAEIYLAKNQALLNESAW
jgi:tetratricopeptide (TPR) repeat protein